MRRYTLRQLDLFASAARHGSLTLAAQDVHLSQPAVSMQMRQLQEAFGLPLFEPQGRGLRLTEAGRELAAHVEEVLERVEGLDELAARWRGVRSGRIRLGVVSTAKYFVPRLLAQFLRAHKGIDFRLSIHNREEIVEELRANTLDFIIMGRPPEGIDCVATAFAPNLLGILCAPEHPLSRRRRLELAQLRDEPFIVREPGSGTRAAMERVFAAQRVKFRATMEMDSNETIKQAVIAGLGLGFLSLHTVRSELAAGRLVLLDVVGLPVLRQWFLVRRTARRLVPAAEEFGQFLLREAEGLINAEGNLLDVLAAAAAPPRPRGKAKPRRAKGRS
ncbi:MAG TPA: LysR family transcriptional regulator [Usitatibacter sp.]|nr:LysR family transcriptional regulator [Usitatibacter sp.]